MVAPQSHLQVGSPEGPLTKREGLEEATGGTSRCCAGLETWFGAGWDLPRAEAMAIPDDCTASTDSAAGITGRIVAKMPTLNMGESFAVPASQSCALDECLRHSCMG